jgi:hypothetical protein
MKPKFRSASPPLLTGLVRRMQAGMPYLVMAGQGGEKVRVGRSFFPSDSRERASTHQNVGTSNGQARKLGGGGGGGCLCNYQK